MHPYKSINTISIVFLLIALIILPVFFLPVTGNASDTSKWMLLVSTALFVLLLWAGRLAITGKSYSSWPRQTLGFVFMAVSGFTSLFLSSGNKTEGLLTPFGPVTFLSAALLLFFGPTLLGQRAKLVLRLGLAGAGGLFGLAAVCQYLGLIQLIFPDPSSFTNSFFTAAGTTAGLLTLLSVTLPVNLALALGSVKAGKWGTAVLSCAAFGFTCLGIGVTLLGYIPKVPSQMLPLPLGAKILIQSWDSLPHTVFGVGPERFFEIYTKFRPQTVNVTGIWNAGFYENASLALHIGTTMGILGLFLFGVLCLLLWADWKTHPVTAIQAVIIILFSFLAPPTLTLLLLWMCFALATDAHARMEQYVTGIPRFFIAFLLFALGLTSFYGLFRWYKGELLLFHAVTAGGNGNDTFREIDEAIKTNPANPAFHMAMSQTTLLLAENLAGNVPIDDKGKRTIPEEDQILLTRIAQRSIQEAKLAVTLSPENVSSWVNVALVYEGLIGLAGNTDVWAIAAYQRASELDPTNPILHFNLGNLYMRLDKHEEAGRAYIQAVTLKPDYADGWHGLAGVFYALGDLDNAIASLQQMKALTANGETDEQKIEQEILSILEEKKTKGSSVGSTSLYVPGIIVPKEYP